MRAHPCSLAAKEAFYHAYNNYMAHAFREAHAYSHAHKHSTGTDSISFECACVHVLVYTRTPLHAHIQAYTGARKYTHAVHPLTLLSLLSFRILLLFPTHAHAGIAQAQICAFLTLDACGARAYLDVIMKCEKLHDHYDHMVQQRISIRT